MFPNALTPVWLSPADNETLCPTTVTLSTDDKLEYTVKNIYWVHFYSTFAPYEGSD